MKKNKRIFFIIIILVIIGIIFGISKIINNKANNEQKLAKIYDDLNSSQSYYFQMEQNSNNKIIMAQKGDKTIIDQYSKEGEATTQSHTTTLIKDNNTYLILHDRKEYYVYEENNVDQTILTDGIKEIMNKEFTRGNEKVRGKKYDYEEYNGSSMFMVSNTLNINENEVKTKFYFDKDDNLVYIKTIDGDDNELIKISLSKDVDDSIFEIPSDYAEN
mgnify:CR=1 FL=1